MRQDMTKQFITGQGNQDIYLFIYSVLFKNRVVFSVSKACFTKEPCTYKDLQKIEYIVENKYMR